jgi:non-ribosomal peptide synthase protein (TIGR01720 family)
VTLLTLEPPTSGEPTSGEPTSGEPAHPAAGRALQAALAAYAEATAAEAGETTVVVEASEAEALPADAALAEALAVPPGYALAVRRPAAAPSDAPAAASEAPETAAEEGGPRRGGDPVETAILEILGDLLGVERVEAGDRFVELGGDSLLALQVLSRVRREVGLELRVKDLMADRPLAELIAAAGRGAPPARSDGGAAAGDRAPLTGRLPLLPSQAWFFERPTENPHLNTVPIFLEAREPLRLAALRQTLAYLHRVHDALRLRIAGEGDDRHQEITAANGGIAFHAVDLSGLEPPRRAEEARRLAAQAQRRVDLFAGPVQRSLWIGLGRGGGDPDGEPGGDPRGDRLLISTHHVAFDARSMQIFFEDLWTAYAACAAGEPPRITPPSATLADWVADLERYLASPRAAAELAWWTEQPWEETAEIPLDEVLGPNVLGSSEEVSLEIGGAAGAAVLRRLPRRWGVDVQEILLAAVVAALSGWTGRERHMVHVVGHGREPFDGGCDPSRILGWFSTPGHPLLLDGGGEAVEVLQSVSRRLRAVPEAGRGYTVLRYFSRDPQMREAIRRIPPTRVLFNYVSRFSDALETALPVRLLHEPLGDTVDPRRDRGILLKVGVGVAPGGRLGLRFGYSANLHRRSTLEGLAERCRSWLEELAGRAEEG